MTMGIVFDIFVNFPFYTSGKPSVTSCKMLEPTAKYVLRCVMAQLTLQLAPRANVYPFVHIIRAIFHRGKECLVSVSGCFPASLNMIKHLPDQLLILRTSKRLELLGQLCI